VRNGIEKLSTIKCPERKWGANPTETAFRRVLVRRSTGSDSLEGLGHSSSQRRRCANTLCARPYYRLCGPMPPCSVPSKHF